MNKEKVLSILGEIMETDILEIPMNKSLTEFGLTSIRFIQFIIAVEEEFNIEVYNSDLLLSNFETIEMVFETLQKYFPLHSLKKVLICDCDNVLWHGISGEEEIYIDEKILTFQNQLITLCNSGILICLCSKNEKSTINEVFYTLDMPLKFEHIVLSKINHCDKVKNIKSIAEELNLSLDSFVFVDDSDYEIGLVNSLLPEIETVKINYDDSAFIDSINSYFRINKSNVNRTKQYRDQKEREKERQHFNSVEEYNDSLQTTIITTTANHEQAERISELSQRTNQFNLSGTRYSINEINDFINNDDYIVIYISVHDKYGDMGIVGASIIKLSNNSAVIESYYLSCRVFDRGFEYVMIETIKNIIGDKTLYGIYNETDKNRRYADFFKNNGVIHYAE